jgi:phenylpropionate dioxygenase-like ring-hydroxylating dioxygenase large terminal subunit
VTVNKELQQAIATRLFAHIDAKSTDRVAEEMSVDEREYCDPDRARRETELVARNPRMVASSHELTGSGKFLRVDGGNGTILVVRQSDGTIRAFRNVCRHRCAIVEERPSGVTKSFSCPYHGWTYGLDGALIRLPDQADSFTSVDLGDLGLHELPAAERHGMVWVLENGEGPVEIEKYLGSDIDNDLSDLNLSSYQLYRAETFHQPANWKLIMDGFLEVYHVRYLHPRTVGKIALSNVMTVDNLDGHMRLVTARKDLQELRLLPADELDLHRGVILTYILLPSTVVVYVRDHVEVWSIAPQKDDPTKCVVTLRFLIPESPASDKETAYWQRNWDTVVGAVHDEDWAMARQIQLNLDESSKTPMILGKNELALHRFHQFVRDGVGE